MALNYLFYVFFFGSLLFFCLFVMTWVIFGGLIKLQIKRWLLASKGYVEVEHISATNVRNYFIMRPKDGKFDLSGGFYHYIPETITRKGDIIRKFDKSFLNKSDPDIDPRDTIDMSEGQKTDYIKKLTAEWTELKNVSKIISERHYDPELLTRKMGMPVITYHGDNPDPINFSDREKVYGSGVIKDMYLRLLLTQRYKDFKLFLLIFLIALVAFGVSNVGLYSLHNTDTKNFAKCVQIFNETGHRYLDILNNSVQAGAQLDGEAIPI